MVAGRWASVSLSGALAESDRRAVRNARQAVAQPAESCNSNMKKPKLLDESLGRFARAFKSEADLWRSSPSCFGEWGVNVSV